MQLFWLLKTELTKRQGSALRSQCYIPHPPQALTTHVVGVATDQYRLQRRQDIAFWPKRTFEVSRQVSLMRNPLA